MTCVANTQTFSYSAEANDAISFDISHVTYDDCYKFIFDEIAEILEAHANTVSNIKTSIDSIKTSVESIKTDINALKVRGVDSSKGIVMAPTWYNDCYLSGGNNAIAQALAILALKNSELLEEYINELQNPTIIPGS